MSIISVIGVLLLVLAGIFLLCLTVVWLEKRFPGKNHDERQERSQGRGYRLSFDVGLFYYGFVTALLMAQQRQVQTIEPYLLVLGGIFLQVVVYRAYCMITQSFMPLSRKLRSMVYGDLILGIIALQMYRWSRRWNLLEDMGYPASFEWVFLLLAVISLFFAFCWLCQLLRREKE